MNTTEPPETFTPRDAGRTELNGAPGSIAHPACRLAAIRRSDRTARGPAAKG